MVGTNRIAVSKDGKMMTETEKGSNARGNPPQRCSRVREAVRLKPESALDSRFEDLLILGQSFRNEVSLVGATVSGN